MIPAQEVKALIEEGITDARVIIKGDDGRHFEAIVISPAFVGKTLLQQHRMVYNALGGRMENEEIHALALRTYTPADWKAHQP